MPATHTVTTYYDFTPSTVIYSGEVDTMFSHARGHFDPVNVNTATAANLTYDLGHYDRMWSGVFQGYSMYYGNTAGSIPTPSTTTAFAVYAKSDGTMWKKNSVGVESALGAGGGGGGLVWVAGGNAPLVEFTHGCNQYMYENGLAQEQWMSFALEDTYVTGTEISIKIPFQINDTTGTALVQTIAYLIRPDTDTMGSLTNLNTSGAAAITNSATGADIVRTITCTLGAAGLFNGVTAVAGHIVKVKATRGTDTSTRDIRMMLDLAKLKTT